MRTQKKDSKQQKSRKILLSSQMHITIHLTLKVGSDPSHVTPYFILGWNRWNVWFGMKKDSGPPGCVLYLTSFFSEYTWVLFNGPNGRWCLLWLLNKVLLGWPGRDLLACKTWFHQSQVYQPICTKAALFWFNGPRLFWPGGRVGGRGI